ncbi:MAG: hypothetical protein D6739_11955 [Nitrospirae bacterium]|nr:MAG: hypothetical protein D6739_11955 [Nitrospirota bacterium]
MERHDPVDADRVTTTLFDLCAAVQAAEPHEEEDPELEVEVVRRLLRRAWWDHPTAEADAA